MEPRRIPITIEHNQQEIVGVAIMFTEDFEKKMFECFLHKIPLRLGGCIDLKNGKILSLSILYPSGGLSIG